MPETGVLVPHGHDLPWDGGPGSWHMNCRCIGLPWFNDPLLDERPEGGRRAAKGAERGPVRGDMLYDEWLRGQPLEFQERVLGKRRAAWFRDHPEETVASAWGKRFGGQPVEPLSRSEP